MQGQAKIHNTQNILLNNWSSWGLVLNCKKNNRKRYKTAPYSSFSVIHVSSSPEIQNWFHKTLFTSFTKQKSSEATEINVFRTLSVQHNHQNKC